jgi:hypothetical protein
MMVKDAKIIGLPEVLQYLLHSKHVIFLWFNQESNDHFDGK